MLALAHEIVVAGDHDQVFLATHCSGSAAFLDSLTGRNDGVVKSAEWAAAITGLDAVRIRQLARELTRQRSFSERSMVSSRSGRRRHLRL
jgi:biotin/methionine sulfoxide reductase